MIADLSSNNHPNGAAINYAAAKAAGVTAVIVKATQGTGYTNPFYEADVVGFVAVGIPVIAYHFAAFTSASAEAAHFVFVAGWRARVLDSETNPDQAWQQTFLTALNLPADEEMDYGSASTLPRGERALLWPASYGKAPGFGDCWQYTSNGTISGIPGNVDLSEWTGSQADYDDLFGLAPPLVPPPPPPPPPIPPGELMPTVNAQVEMVSGFGFVDLAQYGLTSADVIAPPQIQGQEPEVQATDAPLPIYLRTDGPSSHHSGGTMVFGSAWLTNLVPNGVYGITIPTTAAPV